jgi:hypothetical protein
MKKLSIVGSDIHKEENVVGYSYAVERMKCWGKMGAFWGGIWGLFFGSALFLFPGIGTSRWSWGLFLKENLTEVIGCIELWRPGTPENRGFWLARQLWGRGLMSEAVQPVLGFAFGRDSAMGGVALGSGRQIQRRSRNLPASVRPQSGSETKGAIAILAPA